MTTVYNSQRLCFVILFLKEPDAECQVSKEHGMLLIACYHHLEESCVEGTDDGRGAHVSDLLST